MYSFKNPQKPLSTLHECQDLTRPLIVKLTQQKAEILEELLIHGLVEINTL